MIADFRSLQQPPGSNSCLPTAVRAVLLWNGEQVTADEVSEWCGEEAKGCLLDWAVDSLREAGYDVEELTAPTYEAAQDRLRAVVENEDAPQPVIVTLQNPYLIMEQDHAVVVINIQATGLSPDAPEQVEFMDPLTGRMEQDATGMFWDQWDFGGRRAFVIRPSVHVQQA